MYKWRRYLTFHQLKKKKSYRSLSRKKMHKRQNDQKGIYVHSLAKFLEHFKKVNIGVTGPKKAQFFKVFS